MSVHRSNEMQREQARIEKVAEELARFDRLPQWAQKELRHLEGRVASLERTLKEAADGSGDSPFSYENIVDRGPGGPAKRFHLPRYSDLSVWNDGTHDRTTRRLDLRAVVDPRYGRILQVSAPMTQIVVRPSCSNVVTIQAEAH